MDPQSWMVRWALLGRPYRMPVQMLLQIPEAAFSYVFNTHHHPAYDRDRGRVEFYGVVESGSETYTVTAAAIAQTEGGRYGIATPVDITLRRVDSLDQAKAKLASSLRKLRKRGIVK